MNHTQPGAFYGVHQYQEADRRQGDSPVDSSSLLLSCARLPVRCQSPHSSQSTRRPPPHTSDLEQQQLLLPKWQDLWLTRSQFARERGSGQRDGYLHAFCWKHAYLATSYNDILINNCSKCMTNRWLKHTLIRPTTLGRLDMSSSDINASTSQISLFIHDSLVSSVHPESFTIYRIESHYLGRLLFILPITSEV